MFTPTTFDTLWFLLVLSVNFILIFSCYAGQSALEQAIQTADSSTKVGAMLKVHVCYIFFS